MKCCLLLLLAGSSVFAATPTTVAQTIIAADNTPLQGRALISLSAPCSVSGVYVSTAIKTVNFVGGAFTVALIPNDNCLTPSGNSTYYNVHWLTCGAAQAGATPVNPCPKGGNQSDQKWLIPTNGSPVTVDSIIYTGDAGGGGSGGGSEGLTGPTGATGTTGTTGSAGSNGLPGATGATGATGAPGVTGSAGATGTNGSNGATGATGATGSAGATGIGSVAYNPADPTQFLNVGAAVNYGGGEWSYSGGCSAGGGTGSTDIFAQTIFGGVWSNPASSASCLWYYPSNTTSNYQTGLFDFASGASPAWWMISSSTYFLDSNGTQYLGVFPGGPPTTPPAAFVGCRANGSGHWFAVIRSGSADLAVADTGLSFTTGAHRLQVDNATGTTLASLLVSAPAQVPNSVRCSIDGASPAIASAAIPSFPATSGGITVAVGAQANGTPATVSAWSGAVLWIQKMARN
jgi:hypothetical protein